MKLNIDSKRTEHLIPVADKLFNYSRRVSREVNVGGIPLGGTNPVRVQSMTSTSTDDIEASIAQIKRIADAGASYVRLTAQGVREAEAIGVMGRRLKAEGRHIPLVADIHFNPNAAMAAAAVVDKVRINPGNFVRPGLSVSESLRPLLEVCRAHGTALRIGVNHGSLSPSVMERYGDTPAGMVESAMEFLRVCEAEHFHDVVVSVKASNTVVMVETVRRLVDAMDSEGLNYPLHLGVTEAGDGEDGRVKSAVGIGTLLAEGIGDTIRVSLSEEPEREVPVARMLLEHVDSRIHAGEISGEPLDGYDRYMPDRLPSRRVGIVGGDNPTVVYGLDPILDNLVLMEAGEPLAPVVERLRREPEAIVLMTSHHRNAPCELRAAHHALLRAGLRNPVIMRLSYDDADPEALAIKAAADFGSLLLDGHRDGICIDSRAGLPVNDLALSILQAARCRISKTEFISCPSCGRTMFDLQSTVKAVKAATSHLTGLKIGIMGCIVNGPGEMADADYGYVGAGVGRVSLYKGRECVEKNIPAEEAIEKLVDLIKSCGDWKEP